MVGRYKELWYGLGFGAGAVAIDIFMHARMLDRTVAEEVFAFETNMLLYRIAFLGFGGVLGWMLWRHNRREREFRRVQDQLEQLARQVSATVTMTYANLQVVLTRSDMNCSPETITFLHSMRDELQALRQVADASVTRAE